MLGATMDEDELDAYLNAIDRLDTRLGPEYSVIETPIFDQLRDERGHRVPGCYRKHPLPTE